MRPAPLLRGGVLRGMSDGEGEAVEVVEGGRRLIGEAEVRGTLDGPAGDAAANVGGAVEPGAVAALTVKQGVSARGRKRGGGEFDAQERAIAHARTAGEDAFGLVSVQMHVQY